MGQVYSKLKKVEIKMFVISTVIFIILIISALTVYYETKMEEKNFFDIVEKHSFKISDNVKNDILLFLSGEVNRQTVIKKNILENKEVGFFKLLNKNNTIVLSSIESEIGNNLDQHEILKVDETKKSFTRVFSDSQAGRIFELTIPVFSEQGKKMTGKLVLGLSMDEIHLVVNATRYKLIALGFSLFMLGGAGILFNVSFYSYRTVKNALENIKNYTNSILLSMEQGVIATDLNGKILLANNSIKEILNINNPIGKNIFEIFYGQEKPINNFTEALENFRGMKISEIEYKFDQKTKFIRITTSNLKNNDEGELGLVILLEDVTEIKELEKRLYREDKVSALGRLASGIAHEIKNPLSAMNINVQLVEEELMNNKYLKENDRIKLLNFINIINVETSRLEEIVNNFTDFTKSDKLEKEQVKIGSILEQVINLIAPEAKRKKIKINKISDVPPDISIYCDRNKIKQLFLNLFLNSLQAMSAEGSLTIALSKKLNELVVDIEDTGAGIKKEDQDKIFDLYFTTKQSGSGLGLSICQRIVEDHNGKLEFNSEYGKKTRFTIKFPLNNNKAYKVTENAGIVS